MGLQVLSAHTENAGWGYMFALKFKPGGLFPGKAVPPAPLLPEPSTTPLLAYPLSPWHGGGQGAGLQTMQPPVNLNL